MGIEITGEQQRELRQGFHERVRTELGNSFYVSPDISCAESTLVMPGMYEIVSINLPKDMPPFLSEETIENRMATYFLLNSQGTTRSRFGQLGIEVAEDPGRWIANTARPNGDYINAAVSVRNHAKRPIFLQKDTAFFYLYYWDRKNIKGDELVQKVGKEIRIDGEPGKDWRFWSVPDHRGNEVIEGIEFLINPDSIAWVSPGRKPMIISDKSEQNHNRGQVDQYLSRPIPESEEKILWIAETSASMELDRAVNGVVSPAVSPGGEYTMFYGEERFQINSVLIRGGNTYGKMRTEIFSSTTKEAIPQYVLVFFANTNQ